MKNTSFIRRTVLVLGLSQTLGLTGCKVLAGLPAKKIPNEVFVLGTLHGEHRDHDVYNIERVGEIVRRLDPSVVLVEIPPDRYDIAWAEFLRSGEVQEPHVLLYPEFTDVIFPIALEGRFQVIPCSAWTEPMAQRRNTLLQQWRTTRPDDTRKVNEAQERAQRELEQKGLASDPVAIHSAEYDALVDAGMEPYERIFGDDLRAGGWTQINQDHYRRISDALDELRWEGRRVLIIFGAWHKGRLRKLLGERDDILLRRVSEVIGES
ncbi:MAG: hypothetical protein ACI9F9_001684 [Candidatus Paceibacteria bacterium]|jgi:hypothetical protein